MSNLQSFLRDNKVNSFKAAKELLGVAPYHINVRYLDNLYRFHYTDDSDMSNPIVQESAGIVLDMENNDIVSYGMNAFETERFKDPIPKGSIITESIDGTLIRLFYRNTWHISTTKSIDAGDAYWQSSKSFKTLFMEACNETGFKWSELNKDYTYSFVLQHPENRNVTPIEHMRIFHVALRNMETLKEESIFGPNRLHSVRHPIILIDTDEIDNDTYWKTQGYVIQTPDFRRYKHKNENWLYVQSLKGNYPKISSRFLEIRNDSEKLTEFLNYFPEYMEYFDNMGSVMARLPELLWSQFKYYMIDQNDIMTNQDFLYHGVMALYVRYKKSEGKEHTTLDVVYDYINNSSNEELLKILGI